MPKDESGTIAQVFPLTKGKTALSSGTYNNVAVIHCAVDGDITLNWKEGGSTTLPCISGTHFGTTACTSVTIVSGIWNMT